MSSCTAVLLHPKNYRFRGVVYAQNNPVSVSPDLAALLDLKPNFDVDFGDTTPAEIEKAAEQSIDNMPEQTKPDDPGTLALRIQYAASVLDPGVEKNFTKNGKADARALSRILGYTVTAAERDEALGEDTEDDSDTGEDLVLSTETVTDDGSAPVKKLSNLKIKTASADEDTEQV